jgi:hypothetical protein
VIADVGKWQISRAGLLWRKQCHQQSPVQDTALGDRYVGLETAFNPYDTHTPQTNTRQIQSLIRTSFREGAHKFLDLRVTGDGPYSHHSGRRGEARRRRGNIW